MSAKPVSAKQEKDSDAKNENQSGIREKESELTHKISYLLKRLKKESGKTYAVIEDNTYISEKTIKKMNTIGEKARFQDLCDTVYALGSTAYGFFRDVHLLDGGEGIGSEVHELCCRLQCLTKAKKELFKSVTVKMIDAVTAQYCVSTATPKSSAGSYGTQLGNSIAGLMICLVNNQHINQSSIAKKAGISREYMNLLIKGKRTNPSVQKVCSIAQALNLTVPNFMLRLHVYTGQPLSYSQSSSIEELVAMVMCLDYSDIVLWINIVQAIICWKE